MCANSFCHRSLLLQFVFELCEIIFSLEYQRLTAWLDAPRYKVVRVWWKNSEVYIEFTDSSDKLSLLYKLQRPRRYCLLSLRGDIELIINDNQSFAFQILSQKGLQVR